MRRSLRRTSSLSCSFEREFFPYYVLPRTTCAVHGFVRTRSSINNLLKINCAVVVFVFLPWQREPSGTTCAPHDLAQFDECCVLIASKYYLHGSLFGTCSRSCFIYPFLPWQHEPYWRRRHWLLWQILYIRLIYHVYARIPVFSFALILPLNMQTRTPLC